MNAPTTARLWRRLWVGVASGGVAAVNLLSSSSSVVRCNHRDDATGDRGAFHKRQTIRQALEGNLRRDTQQSIGRLRSIQAVLLTQWQHDEQGWRDLPARAWPSYQPNEQQLQGIQDEIQKLGCSGKSSTKDPCRKLLFDRSVSLVFYAIDPMAGLEQFETLARQGDVDSMVACGVILVEGIGGVPPDETKAMEWLKMAAERGSPQACYELGVVYYTGIDGVVDEDSRKAFELFQQAAKANHTAALFMLADQLIEGDGCQRSVSRAIPLLERAADQGHRYARQRIRELILRYRYTVPADSNKPR